MYLQEKPTFSGRAGRCDYPKRRWMHVPKTIYWHNMCFI